MEVGAPVYREFGEAWEDNDGYRLARTLSPDLTPTQLANIYQSINPDAGNWRNSQEDNVKGAIKRGLQASSARVKGLTNDEIKGWTDVYYAYWTAAGSIASARTQGQSSGVQVSLIISN